LIASVTLELVLQLDRADHPGKGGSRAVDAVVAGMVEDAVGETGSGA